jgi:hypothetical protein
VQSLDSPCEGDRPIGLRRQATPSVGASGTLPPDDQTVGERKAPETYPFTEKNGIPCRVWLVNRICK